MTSMPDVSQNPPAKRDAGGHFSPEELASILLMALTGKSVRAIAKAVGCSARSVSRRLAQQRDGSPIVVIHREPKKLKIRRLCFVSGCRKPVQVAGVQFCPTHQPKPAPAGAMKGR